MGYNLSRIPAEELNIALQFDPSIHASYPQIDVSQRFASDDLLIIYTAVSGASYKGLLHEFKVGRNVKPYMVLVTTNSKHPLRRSFDEVFVLPTATVETSDRTVLADTFSFLMFNDMLTGLLPAAG
jgi:DNA-binding MurR/RpiR family transcriptional regulator